jgi:chaperonin cofactor prefoldin
MTAANIAFTTTLKERNEATHIRLDAVNTRITELDEKFEREKAEILRYVDERGAELTRMLNQFKVILRL